MIKFVLVLLLSFFSVVHSFAQIHPWKRVVFENESGSGYNDFVAKNAKWIENNQISTRLLGLYACTENKDHVKKYLSPENQKDENCVTAFVAFNLLGTYDDKKDIFTPYKTISLSDFIKIGQSGGFMLPFETDLTSKEVEPLLKGGSGKPVSLAD